MGIGEYANREFSAVDPKYYRNHKSKVECIDIIRYLPFPQGNAIKYLWRAGNKGGPEKLKEDLSKTLWYVLDAMNNGAYINVWKEEWSVGLYKEAFDRWDRAEKPGNRKEAIKELLAGNVLTAMIHIENMIKDA